MVSRKSATFASSINKMYNIKNRHLKMEEMMNYREYKDTLAKIGISYLGATRQSAKMRYSYNAKVVTYCIYLAPYNMSGKYNVCPKGQHCSPFCLNSSGRNKGDIIAHGKENSRINISRIKKTKLFYEDRKTFMRLMMYEINMAMRHAEKNDLGFAVRLNGTSDISPLAFKIDGKNILELYPYTQFYDYTKVFGRIELQKKYRNYDVTFSFDGYNWEECEEYLEKGGRVAVVFENELPISYKGWLVFDGNSYDMRYLDPQGQIVGLHYHRTANDYASGKYVRPNTPFVIREDDPYCTYAFKCSKNGME